MGIKSVSPPQSIKGYEILERLAAGGFGAVYRVKQSSAFGREVAMKVILPKHANQPEFIRRFEAEAEIIARLEHPYIVPLYDYWRDPNGAYLIMRYLRGGSVKDILENDGAYGLEAASLLLNQVASALEFAHRHNVVHRDIKPGNILLDEDGQAYVADFGIAKDLVKKDGDETAPESVVGSLDYISPEQARSEPVSARTDIYSLGVTLYEMIVGEHPFKRFSVIEKLYKHINDPLPDISLLDEDLNNNINVVIHKATAKNPAERYSDVLALAQAFREAANLDTTEPALRLIEQLTLKEHEFLQHLVDGLSIREIADAMFITESGVRFHRKNVYKKLGVKTRVQAIIKARDLDLIYSDTTLDADSFVARSDSSIVLPEPINPYKGLQAFQISDAPDFFGREKFIERLLNRLQEGHDFQRFLAIIGPSGSGKSSLVKAGLLPALLQGKLDNNDRWYMVDVLPGDHPLDKLETALERVANEHAENIYQHLQRDERGLLRVADLILPHDKTELLIYIDQFEEVFTLCEDEAERQAFLNLLYTAVTAPRSRVRVIISLRADYYDKPLHYHQFGEMLRNRIETILPLSAKELERAIVGPAERVHLQFETGLVAQIVSEMTYQAAALPLLQYALTELFNQREERLLTHAAYHAIGGAVGALANRAEDLYQELDVQGRALCKQLFLRLVTLGEGAEDTRRRARFSELLSIGENADLMEEIIDNFADYRLLTLDHDEETRQPTVEVAHEAILRLWERLRQWLNDSRDDIREERILAQNADEWIAYQRNNGYLLREGQLERFQEWQSQTAIILTPLETEFIEASIRQHQIEEREKAEQVAREEFMKKRELELIRQRLVRTRALVAVFVLAAILSVGFGVFALNQRNEAQVARDNAIEAQEETANALDIAKRSGMAFAANAALEIEETDLAIALALESADATHPLLPETQRVLERIENQRGPRLWIDTDTPCRSYEPTDRYSIWISCDSEDRTLAVRDVLNGEEVYRENLGNFEFYGYWFTSDDTLLAIQSSNSLEPDTTYTVWETETWKIINTFTIDEPHFGFAWVGNSNLIAALHIAPENVTRVSDESLVIGDSIKVYDVMTGELVQTYRFDGELFQTMAFSADGTMGIVGGLTDMNDIDNADYRIIIFDTSSGDILHTFDRYRNVDDPLLAPLGGGGNLGFSADNQYIWFGGYPNYAIELATGADYGQLALLKGRSMQQPDINFKYTTNRLNNDGGSRQVFNIQTGELISLENFAIVVNGFEPDTLYVQNHGRLDEYQLWDIAGRNTNSQIIEYDKPQTVLDYSPDGSQMVVVNGYFGGTSGSTTIVYDTETTNEVMRFDTDTNLPFGVDWSPNGRYIATVTYEEGVIIWDTKKGIEIRRLTDIETPAITTVAFTEDSQYVLSGQGGIIRSFSAETTPTLFMWDVETGDVVRTYELPAGDVATNWGITSIAVDPLQNRVHVVVNEFWDGTIQAARMRSYIVNLDSGEIIPTLPENDVFSSDYTPDGAYIVTAEIGGNTIWVLDADTGEIVRSWQALDSDLLMVDVSPNGEYIATGSGVLAFETAISLWDFDTGELIRRYFGHGQQAWVIQPLFSPDNTQLTSTAFDNTVRIWDVDTVSTLDWVRNNRVVREFTCVEREQYRIEPLCEN